MFFSWVTPLVRRGWSTPLTSADLDAARWAIPSTDELLARYEAGAGNYKKRVWHMIRRRLALSGLLFFVYCATQIAQPLLLRQIVIAVQSDEANGLWCAFAIGGCGIIGSMAKEAQLFTNFQLGAELRAVTVALVYRRALDLRQSDLPPSVSNLLTNDAQKLLDALPLFHQLWATPTIILAAAFLLVSLAGWASLLGIAVLVCLIPTNLSIVRQMRQARARRMPLADLRVARCVEMVKGIRVLKFNGWDGRFEESILAQRLAEMPLIRRELRLYSYQMSMTIVLPQLATAIALIAVSLTSPAVHLTAELAFPTLSLFSVIRFPLMFFGDLVGQLVQASVALRRIDEFLSADTQPAGSLAPPSTSTRAVPSPTEHSATGAAAASSLATIDLDMEKAAGDPALQSCSLLELDCVSVAWRRSTTAKSNVKRAVNGPITIVAQPQPTPVVHDMSLSLAAGELLMLAGPVGSGKSSTLSAILDEAVMISGSIQCVPTVAFCSQIAWVQNLTVRENILFGLEMDKGRYLRVLEACCLHRDLAELPHADGTVIGERGVTLSGGQKQRVALARAAYAEPKLMLLDDCFSALDGPTGQHIFAALFIGENALLRHAACLLVSHATQYAPHVTRVLLVNDGRTVSQGPLHALQAQAAAPEGLSQSNQALLSGFLASIGAHPGSATSPLRSPTSPRPMMPSMAAPSPTISPTSSVLPPPVMATAATLADGLVDADDDGSDDDDDDIVGGRKALTPLAELIEADAVGARDDFKVEGASSSEKLGFHSVVSWVAAMGGWSFLGLEVFFFVLERISYVGSDVWLSAWTTAGVVNQSAPVASVAGLGTVASTADTHRYIGVYASLICINSFGAFARTTWFAHGGANAAEALFIRLLRGVVRSPMAFYDTTPVGRLTARLSYDTEVLDGLLIMKGLTCMASVFWMISGLSVVLTIVPVVGLAMLPCGVVYGACHLAYLRAGVQIQRVFAQSQSPLVSHIEESLAGGATIRAFRCKRRFRERLAVLNDDVGAAFLSYIGIGRWLAVRLEVVGALVSFSVAVACWALRKQLSGSLTGLVIIWSFNLTITLNFFVLSTSEFESKGVSLERVLEYVNLPSESEMHLPSDRSLNVSWPAHGALDFKDVTLRYRKSLPPALDGFSFSCRAGEHTGIVGRSGAGKSTIATALFRLVELESGSVRIDGVDLASLGLWEVRARALAIIPQEPVLFKGSVRRSLDPLEQHADEELWAALRTVDMERAINEMDGGLNCLAEEGGANWSVGERQLLCFSRALLRSPRVLLLDEATASVDHAADERIQRAIRTAMRTTTLLTVAHRLHTVVDYDTILVMGGGKCIEQGSPHQLLQRPESALGAIVSSLGTRTAARLRAVAKMAEERRGV